MYINWSQKEIKHKIITTQDKAIATLMASPIFQILPIEEQTTPHSTPTFRPAAPRRSTPSFSSSSRSNSWDSCFESSPLISSTNSSPPFSPTPLTGIPFSWEKTPGIPKNRHGFDKKPSGHHLLPLPPAGTTAKKVHNQSQTRLKRDPFFAALVECSKGDDHDNYNDHNNGFKINRFGFINFMSISCKRSCAVSESIAPHYLLHPRRHRSS